jgi:hypothetical protein
MRENAKYERVRMRDARKCEMRANVKMPKRQHHKNTKIAKIAKVVTLQQVQYKVLLYGLYTPLET